MGGPSSPPLACATCGMMTNDAAMLVPRRRGRSRSAVCRECIEAHQRRSAGWTVAAMVALAVVGSWFQLTGRGVVTGADGRQVDIGALMFHSSLIYLCSFVHVVPHE